MYHYITSIISLMFTRRWSSVEWAGVRFLLAYRCTVVCLMTSFSNFKIVILYNDVSLIFAFDLPIFLGFSVDVLLICFIILIWVDWNYVMFLSSLYILFLHVCAPLFARVARFIGIWLIIFTTNIFHYFKNIFDIYNLDHLPLFILVVVFYVFDLVFLL